jgi:hypothetical protein
MRGMYLEEFEAGTLIEHTLRRTVTEMDNMLFSNMTLNPQPLHIDFEFCKTTEFGQPLVNSLFTLGLMIGISVNDTTVGTTIANLGMSDVTFPNPLFPWRYRTGRDKSAFGARITLQARSRHRRVRTSGFQSARQAGRPLRPPGDDAKETAMMMRSLLFVPGDFGAQDGEGRSLRCGCADSRSGGFRCPFTQNRSP